MKLRIFFVGSLLVISIFSGCSTNLEKVKPWERKELSGNLLRSDFNPMEAFDRSHIYFSKEGTSGGFSSGGGGCGCN